MPQTVAIRGFPRVFEFVKAMQTQELDWGDGYRELGREALAAILRSQMAQPIDEHLDRVALPMRTTGATGLIGAICGPSPGDIKLAVPRTRRFAPIAVLARPCAAS